LQEPFPIAADHRLKLTANERSRGKMKFVAIGAALAR
jgi:hypothetical protein